VTEYLEFGYVTDDRVIYRGAAKVPAATIVEWSEGRLSTRVYWKPPIPDETIAQPSFREAVEETERLFLDAVEKRFTPMCGLVLCLAEGWIPVSSVGHHAIGRQYHCLHYQRSR